LRPFFCHHERAVNEAFREVYGPTLFKVTGESLKDFSEYARFDPLAESAIAG
jgi:hypothetical protein